MNYPGNSALSSAVKDRVVSTFQQALALHHQGRSSEVEAGCTLILQMDPSFDPARKLLEKSRNPALPIDVDQLLPRDERSAMEQAREAMAQRDFERALHITTDILTNDLLNDDARILGDEAREKLEAAPFVEQFARKCDLQLAGGNTTAARAELEKARALDPTHPEVVRLSKALAAAAAAPQAPTASPSFVVDDRPPAATGRSTAQAADFGFAFEEEKPAEVSFANFSFEEPAPKPAETDFSSFSFDSPAPAAGGGAGFGDFSFGSPAPEPPPPAVSTPVQGGPAEFDFTTASVATSAEDQKKIEQFLTDGDRAFAGGDYQQAIDLWSRIFLIDVTNDEASERIERAKTKRREIEQKIEPLLTSGVNAFENGNTTKAHADLSEVLRLDPQNPTALDYLERLGEAEPAAVAASNAYVPPKFDDSIDNDMFADEPPVGRIDTPLIPPPPAATSKKETKPAKVAGARRPLPMTAIAAVVGALVIILGGWFVWSRFMNSPESEPGAAQAVIARASSLASAGKYDQAIALLQDIKPDDPQHDQALVMIADLRAKKASSAQLIDGIPAQQFYDEKIAAARTAFGQHDYAAAKAAFDQAQRVKPIPPELKPAYDAATQQMAKIGAANALFAERKYSEAISNLESLLQQDPENQTIRRMITDAHFNLGAVALQEERLGDAVREFEEVLKVDPSDELARRSRDLATRYEGQPKDLLYRIYVKYLPLRQSV
jgi:tetratricopeptide (TPR) repeat protein